jgi:adenylosuccinate lyase
VKHDVIAFLTNVAEHVGPEARFLHQGMTSSDVLDTCLAVQLSRATDLLIEDVDLAAGGAEAPRLRAQADARPSAAATASTPSRPPSASSSPATMPSSRAPARLVAGARRDRHLRHLGRGRHLRQYRSAGRGLCRGEKMGLAVEPVSTQVIPRDRHAMFFATLGVVASSVERLATEIRHLQRTEVLEAEEYFSPGQKGSSAMPHKRNPVLTENLTGLARMVRGYVTPALENVALWHERDISHSSVERYIGPTPP